MSNESSPQDSNREQAKEARFQEEYRAALDMVREAVETGDHEKGQAAIKTASSIGRRQGIAVGERLHELNKDINTKYKTPDTIPTDIMELPAPEQRGS